MIFYENSFKNKKIDSIEIEDSFAERYQNITSENCSRCFTNSTFNSLNITDSENIQNAQFMFSNSKINHLNMNYSNIVNGYYMFEEATVNFDNSYFDFQHIKNADGLFANYRGNTTHFSFNCPELVSLNSNLYSTSTTREFHIDLFNAPNLEGELKLSQISSLNNANCPKATLSNVGCDISNSNFKNAGNLALLRNLKNVHFKELNYENLFRDSRVSNTVIENLIVDNVVSNSAANMFYGSYYTGPLDIFDFSQIENFNNAFLFYFARTFSDLNLPSLTNALGVFTRYSTFENVNISNATGNLSADEVINCNFSNLTSITIRNSIENSNLCSVTNIGSSGVVRSYKNVNLSSFNGIYVNLFGEGCRAIQEFENVQLGEDFDYTNGYHLLRSSTRTNLEQLSNIIDFSKLVNVTNFAQFSKLTEVKDINFCNVVNGYQMFDRCNNLITFVNVDLSNMTSCGAFFDNCPLTNVSNILLNNLINGPGMFSSTGVSNIFNTPKLSRGARMYMNTNISELDFENFDNLFPELTESYYMFANTKITNIMGLNKITSEKLSSAGGMFANCNINDIPNDYSNCSVGLMTVFSNMNLPNLEGRTIKIPSKITQKITSPNYYDGSIPKFVFGPNANYYDINIVGPVLNYTNVQNLRNFTYEPLDFNNLPENSFISEYRTMLSDSPLRIIENTKGLGGFFTNFVAKLEKVKDSEFYVAERLPNFYLNSSAEQEISNLTFKIIPNSKLDFQRKYNIGTHSSAPTRNHYYVNSTFSYLNCEIPKDVFENMFSLYEGHNITLQCVNIFPYKKPSQSTLSNFTEAVLLNPNITFYTSCKNLSNSNMYSPFKGINVTQDDLSNYLTQLTERGFHW